MQIHKCAARGDIEGVARELAAGVPVDSYDNGDVSIYISSDKLTPLMCAAYSDQAGVEMLQYLVANGADVNAGSAEEGKPALGFAVSAGDVEKTRFLLDAGADIHYTTSTIPNVMIEAMYSGAMSSDRNPVPLVSLLIERGAPIDGINSDGEFALSAAFDRGRFDVVRVLMSAGANPARLGWTPLIYAIGLGTLEDVERALAAGADPNTRDSRGHTPWLLSLQTHQIEKARLLLAAGANRNDVGHCGKTPLMYAIENDHLKMLSWLIQEGFDVDVIDDFKRTALMMAAEDNSLECMKILLKAGASRELEDHIGDKAIRRAGSIEAARLLIAAGDDINDIDDSVRAAMTGVEHDGDLETTREAYESGKNRVFGTANPEVMKVPFWQAMVRSGVNAWRARDTFNDQDSLHEPVWSYQRFGKSITELPDGRFIEIAGEHEDYYDADFCIYNDVVVHYGGGRFDLLGYPEEIFPPTDFHSATLVGDYIYVIGSLGYPEDRRSGETPVYRLHCSTYAIEKVAATGSKPGWINRHKAVLQDANTIRIFGGKIWRKRWGQEEYRDNEKSYLLDLSTMRWSQT